MILISILRLINGLVLLLYISFIFMKGIRLNLLTIFPVVIVFLYDLLGGYCISKLKEYNES